MANFGRFIDRSPSICAAGKPSGGHEETVWKCVHFYPYQEQMVVLKHDGGIYEDLSAPEHDWEVFPLLKAHHRGIFAEGIEELLPPVQTYDQLENSYEAYWNKVLRKHGDLVSEIPAGLEPGMVTSLAELVRPLKTVSEVLFDSQVGHDHYIISHDDYNPGEHVNRRYTDSFDKDKRYGMTYT